MRALIDLFGLKRLPNLDTNALSPLLTDMNILDYLITEAIDKGKAEARAEIIDFILSDDFVIRLADRLEHHGAIYLGTGGPWIKTVETSKILKDLLAEKDYHGTDG